MPSIGRSVIAAMLVLLSVTGCRFVPGGPPLAPGTRLCIGLSEATCQAILSGRQSDRAGVAITAFRIRCNLASCTPATGEAIVDLAWADGMVESFSYSWVGGP